jgi:urea carboxylase-associated protein 2
MVDTVHEESPEFYRQRYLELKARAQEGNTRRPRSSITENPIAIPRDAIVTEDTIPGGWYWTHSVRRGQTLRIASEAGTEGVSVLMWNADDTSERLNPADTVKVQWTARIGRGKLLLSDMGRVLASITADSSGLHDCITGGSTPESNARKYGEAPSLRNTRDNFLLAAAKHGLGPRDVGPCVTFFAGVTTDESGRLVWRSAPTGAHQVDLRAEMNLIVALSNCPHPLSPSTRFEPQPVRAIVWRSPPPAASDLCRTATEEAIRAFENTDATFAG